MVLAYLEYEELVCSGCGGYLPETTHADHEGGYVAGSPHRCHRCTAVERKRKEYDEAPEPGALVVWPADLRRRNG